MRCRPGSDSASPVCPHAGTPIFSQERSNTATSPACSCNRAPHALWIKGADETLRGNLTASYRATNSTDSLSLDGGDVTAFLGKD